MQARDIYHGRESEVERLRRENAASKDVDKVQYMKHFVSYRYYITAVLKLHKNIK